MESTKKIIFLDRDDTINKDYGYISKPQQIELLPYVIEGLSLLKDLGYEFIIITNQSGMAKKYFTKEDLIEIHKTLLELLKRYSISILDIFYCPHSEEDNCDCRKPKPGLIKQAIEKYKNIDLENSWIIGDKIRDILSGSQFNLKGILLQKEKTLEATDIPRNLVTLKENLYEAALFIKNYNFL
ncbi:MAG: D-glycero-alpha-D-manno-heptose-1,7-bisphosphate 7-phosphatase [Leptonema sp. (in: bacteria)]